MRKVTLLIAIVFISTGVMGQSMPFDLGELISLLYKDKFEVASAAMVKEYELAQNDGNTIFLRGFNFVGFLESYNYALMAAFKQEDGTISQQPVSILYMFEENSEFADFNSRLKNGDWKTEELPPNKVELIGKGYSNGKVKVVIGILSSDALEDLPYKYFVVLRDKDAQDIDFPALKGKADPKPPKVLYPGKRDGAKGNQGDVDARALYGVQGGGGSMLEMAGWMWDSEPDPKETTSQSGKIVFEVLIDDRGTVTSVKAISYTVSARLVRIYQAEVEQLKFSRTTSGAAPPSSKGKITFVIKAK